MADTLLDVQQIEEMRAWLHDAAQGGGGMGLASEYLDALCDTAVAYHVEATDPTSLRDQLAAQLAGVAEVVAKHHRDLMAQDELPEYLVDRLVENLHTTLLTAGGGA